MTDYSSLSDFEINKAVADYLGYQGRTKKQTTGHASVLISDGMGGFLRNYCNNPEHAWPIITENHIVIAPYRHTLPCAWPAGQGVVSKFYSEDANPLRAAMICYLMMKDAE